MSKLTCRTLSVLAVTVLISVQLAGCGGAEDRKAAYFERGQELAASGDFEKARVEFRNVLQIDPKDARAHFALAQVLEQFENWQEAAVEYQRVLLLDETHVGATVALGKLYLKI